MATALLIQADEEKNLETYSLVWLDATVSYAQEFPRIQQRLRSVINDLKIFKQTNECLQYIHSVPKGDQIVLIVSGRFGQEIVPLIHNLQQIISIYVYCMNKQKNDQWASHYPKIKSLVVNLDELVNTIRDYHTARQRNKLNESLKFIAIPILAVDQEQSSKHLYDSFIFSYLLIDDLRRTNSASTDKIDLLSICQRYYAGNEDELKILEEFDQNYTPSRALWWYTRQSFLYRILNKALRDQNLDLLLLFRFYLHDIERQLEKMKYSNTIHVYSGQLILTQKLERFKKTVGGFILTNAFLSANSKHQVESYLADMNCSDEYQRVLFEIEADPRLENIKPFSNITAQNYFPNEEQILFMPGTIFRFKSIQIDENQLWIIQLVLCSENDHHLRTLFYQEDNSDPGTSFGHVCCRFRGFPEAEKYYLHMVKGLPSDHADAIVYYNALGNLNKKQGNYETSLQWFKKVLDIQMELFDKDHLDIGDSYVNMAEIYLEKDDYKPAKDLFYMAMKIFQTKLGKDHPKVTVCFSYIGDIHQKKQKYSKALEAYEKAHVMYQKQLPPTDSKLADSYKNIATTQTYLKNFDHALNYYDKSLQIYAKSVPPSYLAMGMVSKSIGNIYESKKKYEQAQSHYQDALAFFQNVLVPTDPHIIQIHDDIQRVNAKLA